MNISRVKYVGDLRTEAVHHASGNTIILDAPPDNHGKGQSFSPSDLMCTSLASCMLTIMGIAANTYNSAQERKEGHTLKIDGAVAEVVKVMAPNPRRVSEIHIVITMPPFEFSEKEKQILEHAARTCPVALSVNPSIIQKLEIVYPPHK